MNPLDRRLRLRKSTVRNLDTDKAADARGGQVIVVYSDFCTDICPSEWPVCTVDCPSDPVTDDNSPSCTTEPHIGCCR